MNFKGHAEGDPLALDVTYVAVTLIRIPSFS